MVQRQRWSSCAKWLGGLLFFVALPDLAQNPAVRVAIDVGAGRHAISPLIYGVAFGKQSELDELNAPL